MIRKSARVIGFFLVISVMLVSCSTAGTEPEFDVTGLWLGQNNKSTIEFMKDGNFHIFLDPGLSDGKTNFGGAPYTVVDNSHITFRMFIGNASDEINIEVEITINSNNVLQFKLEGNTYRFVRADS